MSLTDQIKELKETNEKLAQDLKDAKGRIKVMDVKSWETHLTNEAVLSVLISSGHLDRAKFEQANEFINLEALEEKAQRMADMD